MGGFEIAALLIGALCGNVAAVVAKPVNLGLFWNSLLGALGAGGVLWLPERLGLPPFAQWSHEFLAAGGAGFLLVLLAGGLVELWYRRG